MPRAIDAPRVSAGRGLHVGPVVPQRQGDEPVGAGHGQVERHRPGPAGAIAQGPLARLGDIRVELARQGDALDEPDDPAGRGPGIDRDLDGQHLDAVVGGARQRLRVRQDRLEPGRDRLVHRRLRRPERGEQALALLARPDPAGDDPADARQQVEVAGEGVADGRIEADGDGAEADESQDLLRQAHPSEADRTRLFQPAARSTRGQSRGGRGRIGATTIARPGARRAPCLRWPRPRRPIRSTSPGSGSSPTIRSSSRTRPARTSPPARRGTRRRSSTRRRSRPPSGRSR